MPSSERSDLEKKKRKKKDAGNILYPLSTLTVCFIYLLLFKQMIVFFFFFVITFTTAHYLPITLRISVSQGFHIAPLHLLLLLLLWQTFIISIFSSLLSFLFMVKVLYQSLWQSHFMNAIIIKAFYFLPSLYFALYVHELLAFK